MLGQQIDCDIYSTETTTEPRPYPIADVADVLNGQLNVAPGC